MGSISGLLITVRTGRQGAAMEKGKSSTEYVQEISTLAVCPEDVVSLGLGEDQKAVLKSSAGEITVTCRSVEGPQGIFFLPLGPLANRLIDEETHGTGVPDFKGIPVILSPLAN
ncbi:MAG: formylmethanofuran dehydrogenase [Peptococcaceae bacterium]|nr:formylmethanofuran dehydrogenase [Peptococcaceae bacterium]